MTAESGLDHMPGSESETGPQNVPSDVSGCFENSVTVFSTHNYRRNRNLSSLWLMLRCLMRRLQKLRRPWRKPRRPERRGEQKKGKKISCV